MSPKVAAHHHRYRARQSPALRQPPDSSPPSKTFDDFSADSNPASPGHSALSLAKIHQRSWASIIRRFHEFIFEFDPAGKILCMWSSNAALSFEFRRRRLGSPLHKLLGSARWLFLRRALRRISRKAASLHFQLPLVLARQSRWFELTLARSGQSAAASPYFVLHSKDVTSRRALAERLRNAEIMLEHAEEIAQIGTWELDLKSGKVLWSRQLFKLHGIDPVQHPPRLDDIWRTLKFKNIEKLRRDFESSVDTGSLFRFSEPYTLPDGSIRMLEGLAAPVADSTGKVVRFVGVTRDVTSQSRTQANLRWLSHQLLTIRNEEQRRVSRELHETTAQTLAALKMTLGQIGRSVPRRNSKVHKLVKTSASLASDAVREVRFVSSFLHPPMLEETGLVTALRSYTKLFAERGGVPVKAEIANDFGRLDPGLELTIFRIVQESLTNVHRHARATSASVRIERDPNFVRVEIKDDGIGIYHVLPDTSAQVSLGVGLAGMRERIDQLQGQFDIVSAVGAGTTIRALLPIAQKEMKHDDQTDAKRERRAQTLSDSRRRRPRHRAPRHSRSVGNGAGH
jgi:signal transduction histidine kinase